jgi:hypothetical protein
MIERDVERHESHHLVNPPEWATHVAIARSEPDGDDDLPPGWKTWWFINEGTHQWSHYNSPVLYPWYFHGFDDDDVDIIPINLNLENK